MAGGCGSGAYPLPPDRAFAVQQIQKGCGAVPGDPDGRFAQAGAAIERRGARAGRHAGGEALRRRSQERGRPGGAGGVDRSGGRVWEPAIAWPDEHAAVDGGRGGVPALLPAAAGTGGAVRAAAAFDGDVARSGGGHRRRGHVRASRDGAVRKAGDVTVGFYSPMPPARTGVADYAAALVAELRRHGRVKMAPDDCDVALYHLGNNALHAEIYRRAIERPGVVTLHDAVLHHFLLGQLDEPGYIEEFVYNYGEWNRGLARELWRGRATSATDSRYFQHALLRRPAERARAVVVHNPGPARAVKEHAPGARVVEIPHLFQAPPLAGEEEVARYRRRL